MLLFMFLDSTFDLKHKEMINREQTEKEKS